MIEIAILKFGVKTALGALPNHVLKCFNCCLDITHVSLVLV